MQNLHVNNLVRSATFFQHAGISIIFVFMPIIARGVTDSIFEIGLLVASFSFAQIYQRFTLEGIQIKKELGSNLSELAS